MENREKICKGCGLLLSLSCFNKHSTTVDGFRAKCKECRRLEHIEYRNKNPERIRELYRKASKKKRKNRPCAEKQKLWYRKDVESGKARARQKRWYTQNKDKVRNNWALRRANKKNASPKWLSGRDKEKIRELHQICLMFQIYTGQNYHVDHIVPLTHERICGLHVPWNLSVLSGWDNQSKSNKLFEEIGIDFTAPGYSLKELCYP